MKRLDRPDKHWKYSANDLPTRRKWDDYQEAYADVFRRTSTDAAPWYVVPADHKWYARLAITEILTQTLIDLDPRWPTVRWDPMVQRRELARTMSTKALTDSLDETDEQVLKAIKDDRKVHKEAARASTVGNGSDPVAEAEAKARAAEASADRRRRVGRPTAHSAAEGRPARRARRRLSPRGAQVIDPPLSSTARYRTRALSPRATGASTG